MVDETVGIDELMFTKKFGMIFENRMYVVSVRYSGKREEGVYTHLPLRVAQMADFIVDISAETVLKQRYLPEYQEKAGKALTTALTAIEGSFAATMFAGIDHLCMSPAELMEVEPRFAPAFTAYETSPDNVFGK